MSADSDIILKAALGAGLVCGFFFCGAIFLFFFHIECWPRPRIWRLRQNVYPMWPMRMSGKRATTRVLTDGEIESMFPMCVCDEVRMCSVCLDNMACGQMVRLFECGHCFHIQCIDPWLTTNTSCPTCRKQLVLPV